MAHEFLLHTNRGSLVVKHGPIGVPKGVQAEIRDANRLPYRMQMITPQGVSMERPARLQLRTPAISLPAEAFTTYRTRRSLRAEREEAAHETASTHPYRPRPHHERRGKQR
jgi:hypothetical protein